MRALWSLPKAAPALLRHMAAYAELLGLDIMRAQREIAKHLVATALVGICALFALLMACIGVIAYTWDGPYRVAAIAWMFAGFVVVAVIAVLYRSSVIRARSPFLADLHRQWQEDRIILDRILSPDGE